MPAGSCALRSLSEMFDPGDLNQKACHVLWQVKLTYFEARSIYQVVGMARLSLAIIDDIQFRAKLAIKLTAGKFTGTSAAIQTKTTAPLIEVLKCKWLVAESMKKFIKLKQLRKRRRRKLWQASFRQCLLSLSCLAQKTWVMRQDISAR